MVACLRRRPWRTNAQHCTDHNFRTSQANEGSPYKPQARQPSPLSPRHAPYTGYAGGRYVPYQYRDTAYTRTSPAERQPPQASQPPPAPAPPPPASQPQPPPSQPPPPPAPPPHGDYAPQMRPRISLLPPDFLGPMGRRLPSTEQCRDTVPLNAMVHYDGGPAIKRMRLSEIQHPLRIDTRAQPAYNPQVEAISPSGDPDPDQDQDGRPHQSEELMRTAKDDLLQQISRVDLEIAKAENQIIKLKKKQEELEEAAAGNPIIQNEEDESLTKHQSPAQKIYAENRKKAQEAHALLDKLGPKVDLPLYNQPSDTKVYHENKARHATFKRCLIEHIKKKHIEKEQREKYLTETYAKLMQEWLRKVEKIESSQKRKAKEAKNREFFEKVFPELRKQREDRERFNRVGARVKSEADLEEIMDGLQEQENEDKKMRSYAVIPPILLDSHQRRITFVNNNGIIDDFPTEYKARQFVNVWTSSEKEIFKEKYLQHPKNFGMISSYLERKSVCDCVQYYYLSKKTENYKQLLRKSRQRTRNRGNNPHGKPSNAAQNNLADVLSGPSGVTTRLQREQLQKQEQPPVVSESIPPPTSMSEGPQIPLTTAVVTTISSTPMVVVSATTVPITSSAVSSNPSMVPASLSPQINPTDKKDTSLLNDKEFVEKEIGKVNSENKVENKKKERRKEDKNKKKELETSDEEIGDSQEKGGAHPCVVCETRLEQFLQSRPLPRSHAPQYGLREEQVAAGARVCNTCRCKAVRSRYTSCPLPTCHNGKARVKRLRPFPARWPDLPREVTDPIILEFQIPQNVTKCCSACFNRIYRKLQPHLQEAGLEDSGPPLRWSDDEVESLRRALREFGTNWTKVAERVGPNKSHHQCRSFYFNCRKKLGLEQLVQEYKNQFGEERKPTVTDEEESGSSTSSCEESAGLPPDNSDTDSAESPHIESSEEKPAVSSLAESVIKQERSESPSPTTNGPTVPLTNQNVKVEPPESKPSVQTVPSKEEYDSSATETADEGQGGAEGERQSPSKSNVPGGQPLQTEVNGPTSSSPVRSVKDLMLGMIEMQLKKTSESGQAGGTPTISSILNTDNQPFMRPDIPKDTGVVHQIREPTREPEPVTLDLSLKKPRDNSETLYLQPPPAHYKTVHSVHHSQSPLTVYRPSTSDISYYPAQAVSTESMRNITKSPSYVTADGRTSQGPTPHLVINQQPAGSRPPGPTSNAKITKITPVSSKLSPKLPPVPAKTGSITHGTPVSSASLIANQSSQPRHEGLLRQMTPPQHTKEGAPMSGSITQGTPVHHSRGGQLYEYYNKRLSPANLGVPSSTPSSYMPPPTTSPYPHQPSRQPVSYAIEQQQISRQIIMNDYITSQQMHGPRRTTSGSVSTTGASEKSSLQEPPSPRGVSSSPHYYPGQYARTTEQSSTPPTRQGVIQRHPSRPPSNGKPPSPIPSPHHRIHLIPPSHHHYPPPGHEAFSSLVDIAVQQPSLPVPHKEAGDKMMQHHEGLGKFLSDSVNKSMVADSLTNARLITEHRDRERYRERRDTDQQRIRDIHLQQTRIEQQRHHQMVPGFREQHDREQPRMMVPGFQRDAVQQPSRQQQPAASHEATRERDRERENRGQSNSGGRGGDSSTLTTASLIDAIIIHQINQSTTDNTGSGGSNQGPTRPGDRLFQSFHREQPPSQPQPVQQPPPQHISDSNGKVSPMKSSSHSPTVVHIDHSKSADTSGNKGVTLAETIDNIISNNYPQHRMYPSHSFHMIPPTEMTSDHHSWKLRHALQQKELESSREREREKSSRSNTPSALQTDERQIIRIAQPVTSNAPKPPSSYHVEPVSPPDMNHHWLSGDPMQYVTPATRPRYYPDQTVGKSNISPLDYVKNKIVEVMRTSEDEKSDQNLLQLQQQRHHYPGGKPHQRPEHPGNADDKPVVFSGDLNPDHGHRDEETTRQRQDGEHHREVPIKDKERCESPGDMVIDEGSTSQTVPLTESGKLEPLCTPSVGKVPSPNVEARNFQQQPPPSTVPTTTSSTVTPAFVPTSTTYAYPFSALNVCPNPAQSSSGQPVPAAVTGASAPVPQATPSSPSRPAEQPPLLSDQYDPLSDEE